MDKSIFANHIVAESIFEESTFEIAFVNCAHGHYLWRRVWNKPCNCPTKNSMNYSCLMLFTSLGQDIMIGILPPPIPPPILNVENLFYSHVFLCSIWNKLYCITVDLGYKNNAYSGFWDITYKCLRSRPKHSYFFVKIPLI